MMEEPINLFPSIMEGNSSVPEVTLETGLTLMEQHGWTWDNMPDEMKLLLQMLVLNELASGNWKEEEGGFERLQARFKTLDMNALFGGYQVNPLAQNLLQEMLTVESQPAEEQNRLPEG